MSKKKTAAKGVTHNLKDTTSNRIHSNIDEEGIFFVIGGSVENLQVEPEGNKYLPKTQRKYFNPKNGNWVTYMRARRILNESVDHRNLFILPENEIIKKPETKKEPESK